jgi:hypothetical protein
MVFGASMIDATSQQLRMRNQFATEKASESLTFLSAQVLSNTLNVAVYNDGGVSINIVRLWITDKSTIPKWHGKTDVNYWIDRGATLTGIGTTAGSFNASQTYVINLATSRGNTFQTIYAPTGTVVATVQGFGWITIDWDTYQYTYSSGWWWDPDHGPFNSWCISQTWATWQLTVKAINHFSKDVKLVNWTYLKFISNSGSDKAFFLMDNRSTAQWPRSYSSFYPVILPANPADPQTGGTPTLLKFLGHEPSDDSPPSTPSTGDYSVLIIVFYQYTDDNGVHTVGQTIPFEATHVGSC